MLIVRDYGDRALLQASECRCSCCCFCTCYLYLLPNANYQSNGCAYGSTNGENLAGQFSFHQL